MSYQVSRNGQLYGPYTLEDLQRYVASGNVLATDLAKSPEMPDWVPVSQLLGTAGAAVPTPPMPPYAVPGAYLPSAVPYPDPPKLNWVLDLLFWFLTCRLFTKGYVLVQASWLQKRRPSTKRRMF